MPLIRGHHEFDDHFTQIPNDWVRDNRLSLKSRGLLAMLMSHRAGWSLSINAIAREAQEGKDALRTAIAELEKLGYLERSQVNESGRYGEAIWTTKDPDIPLSGYPLSENPSIKKNISKEEQSKNTMILQFEEFWKEYPRKVDRAAALRAFKSALKRASFEDLLAGAIAYRNDPARKPEFTKYPATWLNADAWLNAAALPEVKAANEARRLKELEASQAYLRQMQEIEKQAVPLTPELKKKLGL